MADLFFEQLLRSQEAGAELGRNVRSLFTKGGTPRQLSEDQASRAQRSEVDRITESNTLRSIGIGALKALSLPNEAAQNVFFDRRIAEGGDRDMQDTIFIRGTTGVERQQLLEKTVEVARNAGVLEFPPQQATQSGLQRQIAFSEKVGADTVHVFNPRTGVLEDTGVRGPTKAGGQQISFTSPDGTEIIIGPQGAPVDASELDKRTRRKLEGDLVRGERSISNLRSLAARVDDKFLTFEGKIRAGISRLKDKLGIKLTKEEAEFLKLRKRFMIQVNQIFNAYRKEITGAAASVQELKGLKESIINGDLGPAEFRATLAQMMEKTQRLQRLQRKILREGVRGQVVRGRDFRKEGSEAALELDSLFLNGLDDDPEAREAELIDKGLTQEEAIQKMIEEGF